MIFGTLKTRGRPDRDSLGQSANFSREPALQAKASNGASCLSVSVDNHVVFRFRGAGGAPSRHAGFRATLLYSFFTHRHFFFYIAPLLVLPSFCAAPTLFSLLRTARTATPEDPAGGRGRRNSFRTHDSLCGSAAFNTLTFSRRALVSSACVWSMRAAR